MMYGFFVFVYGPPKNVNYMIQFVFEIHNIHKTSYYCYLFAFILLCFIYDFQRNRLMIKSSHYNLKSRLQVNIEAVLRFQSKSGGCHHQRNRGRLGNFERKFRQHVEQNRLALHQCET